MQSISSPSACGEVLYIFESEFSGNFYEVCNRPISCIIFSETPPIHPLISSRIPCVLVENSGRVADLLIHALNSRTQLEQNKTAKDEKLMKEIEKIGNTKDQKFMKKIPEYYDIVMKCLAVYKVSCTFSPNFYLL